jgi:hypothetical protein
MCGCGSIGDLWGFVVYASFGPCMDHPCSMRIVWLYEPYVHDPVAIFTHPHPSFSPHPLSHNCTGFSLTRTAKRSTGLRVTSESVALQRYGGEAITRRTTVLVAVPWRLAAPDAARCSLLPSFTAVHDRLCRLSLRVATCLLPLHTPFLRHGIAGQATEVVHVKATATSAGSASSSSLVLPEVGAMEG